MHFKSNLAMLLNVALNLKVYENLIERQNKNKEHIQKWNLKWNKINKQKRLEQYKQNRNNKHKNINIITNKTKLFRYSILTTAALMIGYSLKNN